jgi:hypothetical protein
MGLGTVISFIEKQKTTATTVVIVYTGNILTHKTGEQMINATKDQLDNACALVYEKVTGKCMHIIDKYGERCIKCKLTIFIDPKIAIINPPLATLLDAWAEHIWPVMPTDFDYREAYMTSLCEQMGHIFSYYEDGTNSIEDLYYMLLECKPIHHLEAALKALDLWDKWEDEG